MATVALFHSVLGVRPGVLKGAEILRCAGHEVAVIDLFDGRVFDAYGAARAFVDSIGYPTLMRRAAEAVRNLPAGFVTAGFSIGGGMAEYIASIRRVRGVLMISGALALHHLGVEKWPIGVDAQVHYMLDDPFRNQQGIDAVARSVRNAGASVEVFDYDGDGHLFTDPSLKAEYDAAAAELLWSRTLDFLTRIDEPVPH